MVFYKLDSKIFELDLYKPHKTEFLNLQPQLDEHRLLKNLLIPRFDLQVFQLDIIVHSRLDEYREFELLFVYYLHHPDPEQ